MPLLKIEGLVKRFAGQAALDGLDLTVEPGEFLALLGGSGSGKSTLLRIIAGFEQADAGRLLLDGQDLTGVPPHKRPLNMMFQSYALFPHLDVFDNVAYGLRREGAPRAEIARRVAEALALVGLDGLEKRRPDRLSGGQRQRVALARSLVKRPRLLLLDEPMAALDAGLRERTGFELRALQRATGAAFVMVTHDQDEAMALADRIALLDRGRLVQLGPPRAVYDRPATRFVAEFLGAANVFDGTPRPDGTMDCPALACTLRAEAPLTTGHAAIRAERIRVDAAALGQNSARGTVEEVAFRGDDSLLLVRMEGGALLRVAHAEEDGAPPARGASVTLAWDPDDVVPVAA